MRLLLPLAASVYLALCGPWALAADAPKLSADQRLEWKDAVQKAILAENAALRLKDQAAKEIARLEGEHQRAAQEAQAVAQRLLKAAGAGEGCELTLDGAVKCPAPKAEAKK